MTSKNSNFMELLKKSEGAFLGGFTPTKIKKFKILVFAVLILASFVQDTHAQTCLDGEWNNGGTCTPCQVGERCNSGATSVSGFCTGANYSNSRSTACSTLSNEEHVAGQAYTCPANLYLNSRVCTTCPTGDSCNGITNTNCDTSNAGYELSFDGVCSTHPSAFTTSSNQISGLTLVAAGVRKIHRSNTAACAQDSSCVDGVQTTCTSAHNGTWDMWSSASSSSCSYCPTNHYCNGAPASCNAGQYLTSLVAATSGSCSACSAGYVCLKDWHQQIKVPLGGYSAASSGSYTICPSGQS